MLTMCPPKNFMRPGETVPHLHPLACAALDADPAWGPRAVWRRFYALGKTPLIVRAVLEGPLEGPHHLDAVLGVGVARCLPPVGAPWRGQDRTAWIVPLPLELLGTVPIPRRNKPLRLPIWAASPFAENESGREIEALCIGDAASVRAALATVKRLGNTSVVSWDVRRAPISAAEAREVILDTRPLPETHAHFCAPYWYDWRGEGQISPAPIRNTLI